MDDLIKAWKEYIDGLNDWESVKKDVVHKQTQCGPVYEPSSPLLERKETFAISDMRNVRVATPHYHNNGETEIYFVIQGSGITLVGGEEIRLKKGSVVVTPPTTTHFTIPESDLVMVVINTPSINSDNIHEPSETDPAVKFDKEQFERLIK